MPKHFNISTLSILLHDNILFIFLHDTLELGQSSQLLYNILLKYIHFRTDMLASIFKKSKCISSLRIMKPKYMIQLYTDLLFSIGIPNNVESRSKEPNILYLLQFIHNICGFRL